MADKQPADIKWELCKGIIHATEAAGLWDQEAFLLAIDMRGDWIMHAVKTPDAVPLDEFVRVYDEAAAQAGWHSAAEIIREVVERQRFGHWP